MESIGAQVEQCERGSVIQTRELHQAQDNKKKFQMVIPGKKLFHKTGIVLNIMLLNIIRVLQAGK